VLTVAIHQPHFFPWLGYLDKWRQCQSFVLLDDVQYPKHDFVNRNRLIINGEVQWMTLPLVRRSLHTLIKEQYLLSNATDLLRRIEANYPYMQDWCRLRMRKLFALPRLDLVEWCCYSLDMLQEGLQDTQRPWGYPIMASKLPTNPELHGTEKLIDICKLLGATHYVSGWGSKAYLDEAQFQEAGIGVRWLTRTPPTNLSALHYLLQADGGAAAKAWLYEGNGHGSQETPGRGSQEGV